MTDTRKQTLSALIDGEASEIEVHRLLREFDQDDELRRTWANYQHIRAVAQGNDDAGGEHYTSATSATSAVSPAQHEALHRAICEAVQADDSHQEVARLNGAFANRRVTPLSASLAVAASLMVGVLFGVNMTNDTSQSELATNNPTNFAEPTPIQQPVFVTNPQSSEPVELFELDEEKQRRLKAYLDHHDRVSRMSNTQFVNYSEGGHDY